MSVDVLFRVFLLLAGTAMVVLFLRRASASTRHTVWVAGLIGSLALPLGALILPRVELPVLTELKTNSASAPPAVLGPVPSSVAIPASSPETAQVDVGTTGNSGEGDNHQASAVATGRPSLMALLWCAGLLATIARAGVGFRHIARLQSRSKRVDNANWLQILASQRRALGSTAALDLRIGGDGIPPMTWGIFRHTILFPSEASEWNSDRIRLVIAHELAHVKRRDGLVQLLSHIACAMYWFNPLAWYASYRLRIERERACDDQVLNLGENPEDYADHLLAIARSINAGPALAALSMADPHRLEARLRAILETTRNRRRLSRLSTRVVCCSGLLASMILACAHLTVFTMPVPPQQLVAAIASPEPLKSAPVQVPARRPQASAPVVQSSMEFMRIPAGSFNMGCSPGDTDCKNDEKPLRLVSISRGFEIGKYEVTQAQWQALMGSNPSAFKGPDLPVETVRWEEIQTFFAKLNARGDGFRYRLPTEAEWEYAARAGSTSATPAPLDEIAWYANNSGRLVLDSGDVWKMQRSNYLQLMRENGNQTHRVGQKKPNAWGLYDMLGNVLELVQETDGGVPFLDRQHIARGGWFDSSSLDAESSARVSARTRVLNRAKGLTDGTVKDKKLIDALAAKMKAEGGAPFFEAAGQDDLGLRIVREQMSPLVWVNATVSKADDGRIVTGLEKQTFQVWEDKAEQSIEAFSETDDPISMGIVMDVSGSMKDVVSTARNAAVSFLKSGDPKDEYFLVSFTSSVSLEQDFTKDPAIIENALPSRSPGGGTTFYDAAYLSLEKVNQGSNSRRVLLIFLGGDDNQSRYTFANLRDFASRQNVQIFAIGMKLSTEGKANLEELTGLHGGKAYFPESVSEINDFVTKVRVELKSQYMLGYRSTNQNRDGLWRKIAVKVTPPVGLPPLTVRAKTGYFPPN